MWSRLVGGLGRLDRNGLGLGRRRLCLGYRLGCERLRRGDRRFVRVFGTAADVDGRHGGWILAGRRRRGGGAGHGGDAALVALVEQLRDRVARARGERCAREEERCEREAGRDSAGAMRSFRRRARAGSSVRACSRPTIALNSETAAARRRRPRKLLPGRFRCGIALAPFVRAPRPPPGADLRVIRGRTEFDAPIGGPPNLPSLDLVIRGADPQLEG